MISHIDLVTKVQRRADVDDDTARAAISAATGAVARQMMNEARERLATALPDTARYVATTLGDVESPDDTRIIQDVARQLDITPEHARHLTRAVLAALEEAEPGTDRPAG